MLADFTPMSQKHKLKEQKYFVDVSLNLLLFFCNAVYILKKH